jgi:heme a synthase
MTQPASPAGVGRSFSTFNLAIVTLVANVVVILQGALVRVTGSGAGCGSHWPTCNGEVLPLAGGVETMIEFSHRLLSLVVLLLGAWLLRRAARTRRERPGLFAFAVSAFAFLAMEALLGALTVLWGLTGDDQSVARGVMVATHLVNSLLLVGALAGTVAFARERPPSYPLRLARQGPLVTVLLVGLVGMLVLMFSGGIAAMGNTMFPSQTLAEGIAADFDPEAHPLVRLRILHPLIAVSVGVYLFLALGLAWWIKPVAEARRLARTLLGVYVVQLLVGTLNLALLAPVVLQLLHLGLAVLAFGLLAALAVELLGAPLRARAPAAATAPRAEVA